MEKEFDLQRFTAAHQRDYAAALHEIQSGKKESHWMWYIFPQIQGLGRSYFSQYYGIQSLEEAVAFLKDPYLADHLHQICEALLMLETNSATDIFGKPDDKKLRSSMTLFAQASGADSVFHKVLDKFFDGKWDKRTLKLLNID